MAKKEKKSTYRISADAGHYAVHGNPVGWIHRAVAVAASAVKHPLASSFNTVLVVVTLISVMAVGAEIWMANIWPDPLTSLQVKASEAMDWAWKIGFGAIVGLIGGKAAD